MSDGESGAAISVALHAQAQDGVWAWCVSGSRGIGGRAGRARSIGRTWGARRRVGRRRTWAGRARRRASRGRTWAGRTRRRTGIGWQARHRGCERECCSGLRDARTSGTERDRRQLRGAVLDCDSGVANECADGHVLSGWHVQAAIGRCIRVGVEDAVSSVSCAAPDIPNDESGCLIGVTGDEQLQLRIVWIGRRRSCRRFGRCGLSSWLISGGR